MKKTAVILVQLLLATIFVNAQKDYKVIFDMTSKDSMTQVMAIRWVKEVVAAEPTAQVELVVFGPGTALFVKDKSVMGDAITSLASNKNVSFRICQVAMQNQNIDKSQLLPGVMTVPDGIYEVITKQRQGWGYIKVAR